MIRWILGLSVLLNLVLLVALIFLNDRYGLGAKVQRVALEERRVPGIVPQHELNRNYQVRREMFRLDRNDSARILMLGDSLTAQGEWNAMLGESLVANRGIDGDTAAGVLARIGDDADFRGDAVVIWIGTNDVLQGGAAGPVTEEIIEAARERAEILKSEKLKKKNLTTKDTNLHEIGKIINGKIIRTTESTEDTTEQRGRCEVEQPQVGPKGEEAGVTESKEESGQRLAGQAGAAFSNPSISELARDSENSSLTHFAIGPASALDAGRSTLDLVLEAPNVFVLGIPPMARWWEGAPEKNFKIQEINSMLAKGAEGNGYRFIELESVLADENGFLRGDMTSDGVHLSAKGYVAVIQKLKEVGLWPAAED